MSEGLIETALEFWSWILREVVGLLTTSPTAFRGGHIWAIVERLHGAMVAVGVAIMTICFVMSLVKTCGTFAELKRPEVCFKVFVRFAIVQTVVVNGLEFVVKAMAIGQGLIEDIYITSGFVMKKDNFTGNTLTIPDEVIDALDDADWDESILLWLLSLVGVIVVVALSIVVLFSVYGRFFKIYIYTAVSPIFLSTYAGEVTSSTGRHFTKTLLGVFFEGAIIILACIIYTAYVTNSPMSLGEPSDDAFSIVFSYLLEMIINMLVLVGTVKSSDQVVRNIMGH